MSYEKRIVCLANSRKKSGRCIAGKEIISNQPDQWIRPVSNRHTEEISEEERMLENGDYPQLLDIISIRFLQHKRHNLQPENHLIDSNSHWRKIGRSHYNSLGFMTDKPSKLWVNGLHSSNGHNDRFTVTHNNLTLCSSLYLIYLENLTIEVLSSFNGKRKTRAIFHSNKDEYNLAITDPRAEHYFLKKQNGIYNVHNVYLCVSVAEFEGYYYKLVASIIKDPPF